MIPPSAKRRRVSSGHAAGGLATEFCVMARLILKLILEFLEICALLFGG
jgi:hypothetical protein